MASGVQHLGRSVKQHGLAEATFQADQSFGATANRLVDRGLIERINGPGRAIRHRLTLPGEAQLEAGREAVTGDSKHRSRH